MSTNDYVKFLTKELVSFMNKPQGIAQKEEAEDIEREKTSYATTLFGSIPFGIKMAINNNIRKEKDDKKSKTTG